MEAIFFILTTMIFLCWLYEPSYKAERIFEQKQKRGFLLAFALIACISVLEVITIVVDGAPTGCRWLNILSNYLALG